MNKTRLMVLTFAVLLLAAVAVGFVRPPMRPLSQCDAWKKTLEASEPFAAAIERRLQGATLEAPKPSALPTLSELKELEREFTRCSPEKGKEFLNEWGRAFLAGLKGYVVEYQKRVTAVMPPPEVAALVRADNPVAESGVRVLVVDAGLRVSSKEHFEELFQIRNGGETSYINGSVGKGIILDVGDLDDFPFSHGVHHAEVIRRFTRGYQALLDGGPVAKERTPVLFPMKTYNFLEGFKLPAIFAASRDGNVRPVNRSTEWTHLISTIEAVRPRIVHLSMGWTNPHQKGAHARLRRLILDNPQILFVVAAGNEGRDLGEQGFYLFPQQVKDDSGRRPANLILVSAEQNGKLYGNHDKEATDVAVRAESTSFAAPVVSALLAYLDGQGLLISPESAKDFLRRLSKRSVQGTTVPLLEVHQVGTLELWKLANAEHF